MAKQAMATDGHDTAPAPARASSDGHLNLPLRSSSPFGNPVSGFATPSRFLNLPSGSGFTPHLGHDGAPASSGVFTPGLLFSSSRVGASGSTPGWWGAAGKSDEINPFEETLSRQSHTLPPTAHQAAVHALGHARRATISTVAAGDLWAHLQAAGGLSSSHGALDSWIDFSGGHPGTPGIIVAGTKRRSSELIDPDLDKPSLLAKRTRREDADDVDGVRPDETGLTAPSAAPLPSRSFTSSSSSAASPNLGPPTLTPHSSSAETSLTPPSALPTTGTPQDGTSKFLPFSVPPRASVPKPAPDPTQAVPQFVGIEHYAAQTDAPVRARAVMAEFLQRMHGGAGTTSPPPASIPVPATSTHEPSWTKPSALAAVPAPVPGSVTAFSSSAGALGMMGSARAPAPKIVATPASASSKARSTGSRSSVKAKGKAKADDSIHVVVAGSPSASEASSASAGPPRRPTLATGAASSMTFDNDEDKRRQFLERNRIAACKSRAKKKEWQEQLESKAQHLATENERLTSLVHVMKDEIVSLRAMVASHASCACGSLKDFVGSGALGVPTGFGEWGLGSAAPMGAATEYLARQQARKMEGPTPPATPRAGDFFGSPPKPESA